MLNLEIYFLKYSLANISVHIEFGFHKWCKGWENTSICNCAKENTFILIQGIFVVVEVREETINIIMLPVLRLWMKPLYVKQILQY